MAVVSVILFHRNLSDNRYTSFPRVNTTLNRLNHVEQRHL